MQQVAITGDIDPFHPPTLLLRILQYGHSSIPDLNFMHRSFINAKNADQSQPDDPGMRDHGHALLFTFLYERLQFSFYPRTKLLERFTSRRCLLRKTTEPGSCFRRRTGLNLSPGKPLPFTEADFTQASARENRQGFAGCNRHGRVVSPL